MSGPNPEGRLGERQFRWTAISIGGLLIVLASGGMTWISRWFRFDSDPLHRPLWWFVVGWGGMFVVGWLAFRFALAAGRQQQSRLAAFIWLVALLSRLVVLPSHPIQEVDIYRYMWDGQVTSVGVSPFRFSPASVVAAIEGQSGDPQLQRLADHAASDPTIETILRRVHFSQLPTVYPAISQAVFAAVAIAVPRGASLAVHLVAMKAAVVCFDLATLATLFWLLRITGKSYAWAITYAWNPLVLKEFAGSGHLDSIAVFFTMLSVTCAAKAIREPAETRTWLYAAMFLALGFGAKLYPILLAPVLCVACLRSSGFRMATMVAAVLITVSGVTLLPILATGRSDGSPRAEGKISGVSPPSPQPTDPTEIVDELMPPIPDSEPVEMKVDLVVPITANQPTDGIEAFLTRWEINDVLFLVIVENLRPGDRGAWFSLTSSDWRNRFGQTLADHLDITPDVAAFGAARCITLLVLAIVVCRWIATMDSTQATSFCGVSFSVLAWFWMLSPTLNPWYWTWALPLIAFAKARGWLLVSGMLAIYYLRFWFLYHADDPLLGNAPYPGVATFDFVVVFVQHVPWMLLVAYQSIRPGCEIDRLPR